MDNVTFASFVGTGSNVPVVSTRVPRALEELDVRLYSEHQARVKRPNHQSKDEKKQPVRLCTIAPPPTLESIVLWSRLWYVGRDTSTRTNAQLTSAPHPTTRSQGKQRDSGVS